MHKCGYPVLLFALLLSLGACQSGKGDLNTQLASTILLGDATKKKIRWKWVQSYDPYNGGQIYRVKPGEVRYLIIVNDGTFEEIKDGKKSEGKWKLKSDKSSLALMYTEKDGETLPLETQRQVHMHQIRKLTRDTMILAWPGRHGYIEDLYVADRKDDPADEKGLSPLLD